MTLNPTDQQQRAMIFRRLHEGPDTFVVANPWDAGSAHLFTAMGFPALATSSAGLAYTLARRDGANLVSRDEILDNLVAIVSATDLPVSADLEGGYAEDEDEIARSIELAAEAGAVGGSVEDATGDPHAPVLPTDQAAARVAAAVAAARRLPFPFTLTARAENFLYGRPDLDDTIHRLRAYGAAGADVLYAPGLPDLDTIRAVCAAVERPVNVLAGSSSRITVADLAGCGVRRVSVGSALARAALTAARNAAQEIREHGTFGFASGSLTYAEANALWPKEE
jgi:2-methylisocitrate lyase-like PEP mutase family enzyme